MPSYRTCFIVMPIGDQEFAGERISSAELKSRYDDLIKEALLKADPYLEITRADDVAIPGTITSDILTRLMHSDIVVADVTYPNPNVFYELGLRHACRPGTIIIRERTGPKVPFDIAHLRHIEYENTATGLKALSEQLKVTLSHFAKHPSGPDSHFLELAKLTQYAYPDYVPPRDELAPETMAMLAMTQSPDILDIVVRGMQGEEIDQGELIRAMAQNPMVMATFVQAMVEKGQMPQFLGSNEPTQKPPANRAERRSKKK